MVAADKAGKKVSKKEEKDEKKNVRPSTEVLDCFYQLVELDKTKRYEGISSLLSKLNKEPEALAYTIERLITGLSSSRAAARIGYSTALTIILETIETNWTVEKLFEVADKKMRLNQKTLVSEAIGHHLLATAIINSGKYEKENAYVVEREFKIMRKVPSLTSSISQLLQNSCLDAASAVKWVESLQPSEIKLVVSVFKNWPVDVKKEVISHLMTRPKSDELLKIVANAIDSLFYVKVRAGERVVFSITDESIEIIRAATDTKEVNKALKKFTNENLKKPLEILYRNMKIWETLTEDDEERRDFDHALSEIATIAGKDDQWNVSVLIDLLISLLDRTHRFVRTVVYFVYTSLLPTIKFDEVKHIIDSLMLDDAEIEEIDEDAEEVNDEEEDSDDENKADDEIDDESEDEDMDDNDVDPEFISQVEEALGDAALKRNAEGGYDSDEESLSDMDDETMFAMDEKLSNLFKEMNPKKAKIQKAQAMHEFRSKVMDLLLFTVSAVETPGTVKVELILPLLDLLTVQLGRKTEGNLSTRTINLLDILSKQKKVSASEKKIKKLLSGIIEKAKNVTNPAINITLSSLTAFIFSLGITEEGVAPGIKDAFLNIFKQFLTQEEGNLSSEVCTAAILKYPIYFASDMDMFITNAFDEKIRIFRRTEALQCIAALLGKNIIKTHPLSKSSAKNLSKHLQEYIKTIITALTEVKPRFFASVLKVLSLAATNLTDAAKKTFVEKLTEPVDAILGDEETLKSLKKANSACNQICGKQASHVLKAISKSLNVEE